MSLVRRSLTSNRVATRSLPAAAQWIKNFVHSTPQGLEDAGFENSADIVSFKGYIKDLEDMINGAQREVAEVPKECPGINFTYYKNRLPAEYEHEVAIFEQDWKKSKAHCSVSATQYLLTAPGAAPVTDFTGLAEIQAKVAAVREAYKNVNATEAAKRLNRKQEEAMLEVAARREKDYLTYAAEWEANRTTMDTTTADIAARFPWIEERVVADVDSGIVYKDYASEEPIPEISKWTDADYLKVCADYPAHKALQAKLDAAATALAAADKEAVVEATESMRLESILKKPPTYGFFKYIL